MKPSIVLASPAVTLSRRPSLGAMGALFAMALRQNVRGRRFWVLSVLFAVPAAIGVVTNLTLRVPVAVTDFEFPLIFNLIPHALAPLAALLYASGIIQDEVEDQTLTYLLLRPLPRWAIYWIKLLAAMATTSLLTAGFAAATYAALVLTSKPVWTSDHGVLVLTAKALWTVETGLHVSKIAGLMTLMQIAYCGLFGLLGLLTRRTLIVGVAYVVLLEGLLASFDTMARQLTVMYYFRVLAKHWISDMYSAMHGWSIDWRTEPTTLTCILTLLGIGLMLGTISAGIFARREFRMKTPEGN
jgi:ABC-2 type transport system permease protein